MLVVCRSCGKLVDEKEAIRMTEASYKTFEMIKLDIKFIQLWDSDHHIYTQICKDCYYEVYGRKDATL